MSVMNVICVVVQLQSHRKNIEFNETFNFQRAASDERR